MKILLIFIVIIILVACSRATEDLDKEEIKRLKALAKILIDKAATNKLNELTFDASVPNHENLLVIVFFYLIFIHNKIIFKINFLKLKALASNIQSKYKSHNKRKLANEDFSRKINF